MTFEDAEKSKKREAAEAGAILPYAASVKGKMRNAVKRRRVREREVAEGESARPCRADN